eukprot:366097-Chlamydomonas_euryale.AAC.19
MHHACALQEVGYFHTYLDGVDYVFVDHGSFRRGKDLYGGDRLELSMRCALLSKAALEAVWHVPCGGVAYGDDNCVFIANDWHTAMLPVYLQARVMQGGQPVRARCCVVFSFVVLHSFHCEVVDTVALLHRTLQAHYRDYNQMTYSRAVFVIHNMAHQGRGPYDEINQFELSNEYKEKFRCER